MKTVVSTVVVKFFTHTNMSRMFIRRWSIVRPSVCRLARSLRPIAEVASTNSGTVPQVPRLVLWLPARTIVKVVHVGDPLDSTRMCLRLQSYDNKHYSNRQEKCSTTHPTLTSPSRHLFPRISHRQCQGEEEEEEEDEKKKGEGGEEKQKLRQKRHDHRRRRKHRKYNIYGV